LLNSYDTLRLLRMLKARIRLQTNLIREYLRTSPALFMARLGSTFAQESEPLLITVFLGPEITTAYMVVRKAADMVFQLLSQIVGSSMGTFAHLASQGEREKTNQIATLLIGVVFVFGLMGSVIYMLLNADFVALWVGEEFILDPWVTILIGAGSFLHILRSIIGQLLLALGDFIYTSMVVFCEGVGRIICAAALIYFGGVWGVPAALLLGCLFSVAFLFVRIRKSLQLGDKNESITPWVTDLIMSAAICLLGFQLGMHAASWMNFGMNVIALTFVLSGVFMLAHLKLVREFYRQKFQNES